jgi:trehalose/maltose hydrolase-like predicted phosphorylase
MAGTWDIVQRCYTGLEARDGVLWLNPQLPPELGSIKLDVLYCGFWLGPDVTDHRVRINAAPCSARPIRIGVGGRVVEVLPGEIHELELPVPDSTVPAAADLALVAGSLRNPRRQQTRGRVHLR